MIQDCKIDRGGILAWLREERPGRLEELWRMADLARELHVGDAVHLRGLVEISNHCARQCAYCGIRAGNAALPRYRMTAAEVMLCAGKAVELRFGTLVLQSGEDPGISKDWMADLIRRVKSDTPLAVTLSLGERSDEEFLFWKQAGADRYLLRFETGNPALYASIHPALPGRSSDRVAMLMRLREMGYEIGSGIMIGIPGQTHDDLARDIESFRELDLDMIGVGPWIAHPATPLAGAPPATHDQVEPTETMTCKVIALARLVCPDANIPSTTALATLNGERGRELGLMRGANVVMPNLTPPSYRAMYEIYPGKACVQETAEHCADRLGRRVRALGRTIGVGRGDSRRLDARGRTLAPTGSQLRNEAGL